MFEPQLRNLFIPIQVKDKCSIYAKNTTVVVINVSEEVNSHSRFPFLNKGLFFFNEKHLWVKRKRNGGIHFYSSKKKGCRKLSIPSKSVAILTKKDYDFLKLKEKPLLSYKNPFNLVCCSLFRVNKKLQLHIDTVPSKVAFACGVDGLFSVRKHYAKNNKSLALVNYQWMKNHNIEGVDCIWSKNFAKLLISIGLQIP